MEIPAALHGLQNQYENVVSHFNFGSFDPSKQGLVFREKLEEYFSNDQDKTCHDNVLFVPIDNSQISTNINSTGNVEQVQIFLETLWTSLSSIQ